jgi:DNA polymerase (family 10)
MASFVAIDNAAIARILSEMADICEIRGDNLFKIRALRNAALSVEACSSDISLIACSETGLKRLQEISGIGAGIAAKILEICSTGSSEEHRGLLAEFPATLLEILQVSGVGPKKVRLFYDTLGVRTIADLEKAAREGRIRSLPKMGEKSEEKLLKAIAEYRARAGRWLLSEAEKTAQGLLAMLRSLPGVGRVEAAGSYRRRRETVGDLDLLVTCADPAPVMARFSGAGAVIGSGPTKTSIRLSSGLQCDLRVVPEESFGAAMHYFTGSKTHNVCIRTLAVRRGLTINEYGVFRLLPDGSAGERVGGATEEEVFRSIDLPLIPPELRENRGEIEAATEGRLPHLIEAHELRGDLHMHTTETDGSGSIEEMAAAAVKQGLGYVAITDHTKSLPVTRGMDEARLADHAARIRAVDRSLGGRTRLLAGVEVDILADGTLDLAPEALRALDVVVGSVHSSLDMPRAEMTERVVRAIRSGLIDILGHPTGRILLQREPSAIDMEAVMAAAKEHGVALEVSAYPARLDLSDVHCRMAKERGVKLCLSTDSHAPAHLAYARYAIDSARRGWLEGGDVLNTRPCDELLAALHAGHR